MFRYLYSYNLDEVGQAVWNTFIGQWFVFEIQTAAGNCTRLQLLHRTSTPRRQSIAVLLPVSQDRFNVWQMALPYTASLSFIPVINHLSAGNGVLVVNSSCLGELSLSLNTSVLASVAENSAPESKDCISQLHLSCDERNCSTEQSAGLSNWNEAAVSVFKPQTSTCTVRCTVDGSCMTSHVHNSFSCLCHICSSHCVSVNSSHTGIVECKLSAASSSVSAGMVHIPTKILTESSDLFDMTDDSVKSVTNADGCYSSPHFRLLKSSRPSLYAPV